MMKVLIACEYSGVVREAFRRRGHEAWSCDLLPADDRSPFHYRDSIFHVLAKTPWIWDLMIAHPPCTYLTCSAEWAYKDPDFERYPGVGYHQKVKPGTLVGAARRGARDDALDFVRALMAAPIDRIAIENPVGAISSRIRKPDQIIQPKDFGDDASKATCLWLGGLPLLVPTKKVCGRIVEHPKGSGKMVERWSNQTDGGQNKLPPSKDRWKLRSDTFPGIANAMAEQWGAA